MRRQSQRQLDELLECTKASWNHQHGNSNSNISMNSDSNSSGDGNGENNSKGDGTVTVSEVQAVHEKKSRKHC